MLASYTPLLGLKDGFRYLHVPRRPIRYLLTASLLVALFHLWSKHSWTPSLSAASAEQHALAGSIVPQPDPPIHLLLLATDKNENLCKVLLSSAILGYASPVLLGWGEQRRPDAQHGGTHALKLSKAHEYLQSIDKGQDDDLVLFVDAYDVQFQLPPRVLVERYLRVVEDSNKLAEAELGRAFSKEGIRNTIFFGAEKNRWPNTLDEVAAWTVPESPLPHDIYGDNTDTPVGYSGSFSRRQRFLNSGLIIGQLGDLRKMFARALERADDVLAHEDSDQRIFADLMGEQTLWRESMRLKHIPWWRHIFGNKPKDNWVDMFYINNILDPSFRHMPFELNPETDYEFGISLDYFSNFSHQTGHSNIGRDAKWITYGTAVEDFKAIQQSRTAHDCRIRAPGQLPDDVSSLPLPFSILQKEEASNIPSDQRETLSQKDWLDVPLYTQICVGSIPVMVHYNGNKTERRDKWPQMWYQSQAKNLLGARMAESVLRQNDNAYDWSAFRNRPGAVKAGGAWSSNGTWLEWADICPASTYGKEIYRSDNATNWL